MIIIVIAHQLIVEHGACDVVTMVMVVVTANIAIL